VTSHQEDAGTDNQKEQREDNKLNYGEREGDKNSQLQHYQSAVASCCF